MSINRNNLLLRTLFAHVLQCATNDYMSYGLERISIDPQICFGRPCIKGTRLWVSLILDMLAAGASEADVLADYPQLVAADIRAAMAYGAEVARERIVPVPLAAAV